MNFLNESERQLLYVAGLPLVDGVFASLLISGSFSNISSIFSIALTVFAGAGSLAVLFSESENRSDALRMVLKVLPFLLAGGLIVGLVAPVFSSIFNLQTLQYVTGLVLLLISFKLLNLDFADRIKTSWILVPGMMVSVESLTVSISTAYVLPAFLTVSAASLALIGFSFMRDVEMNLSLVRKGSALILGLFSLSMFGLSIPSGTGLALFSISLSGAVIQPRIEPCRCWFLQLPGSLLSYRLRH